MSVFWFWLLSLIIMFTRFIYVVACIYSSFFSLSNISFVWISCFIDVFINWWTLRLPHFVAVMNNSAWTFCTSVCMDICFHFSWVYTEQRNIITLCLTFEKLLILHFHQQCKRALISSQCPILDITFLIIDILEVWSRISLWFWFVFF